jgi:hypothetical protein
MAVTNAYKIKLKETTMKLLTMTIAALSFAAVTSASASVDPTAFGSAGATNAAPAAKAGYVIQAQRRRKCQEDLGYGRTGNFGCGG